MTGDGRLYLNVPYSEKDQAKAVGARWDPTRRQWWVDTRHVPSQQVARWLAHAAPTAETTPTGSASKVQVCLLGLSESCWRCKRPTTALVGMLPVASRNVNNMLACKDERALELAAAALPEQARQAHRVGWIKSRYSKTENKAYLSNGCFHCDALVGNFFLYYRELRGVIEEHDLAGLTEIARADVSFDLVRPLLVRSNTWAGAVLEENPVAYMFDQELSGGEAGGNWDFDLSTWRPASEAANQPAISMTSDAPKRPLVEQRRTLARVRDKSLQNMLIMYNYAEECRSSEADFAAAIAQAEAACDAVTAFDAGHPGIATWEDAEEDAEAMRFMSHVTGQ